MLKRNPLAALILCAFVFASLSLLSAVGAQRAGADQPRPQMTLGVAIKDVEVKLGENPGGSPAARATTNAKGEFNFGVVPAGRYDLIVNPPSDLAGTQAGGGADLWPGATLNHRLAITIVGVKGGPIKKDLELKPRDGDASRHVGQPKYENISLTIDTDGKSEVKGTITGRAGNNPGVK